MRLGLALYFNAWFELDDERRVNEAGVGRIPLGPILTYAREYGFSYEQREDLVFYIRHMDKAFVQSVKDKTPKPQKPPKSKGWFR